MSTKKHIEGGKYYVLARGRLVPGGKFEHQGFIVVERATDQTIKHFDSYQEAIEFAKSLRTGRAFDGWTPSFMLKNNFVVSEKSSSF
jgi:hypothetical protein